MNVELPDDPLSEARMLARVLASMLTPDQAWSVAERLSGSDRASWIAGALAEAIGLDEVVDVARRARVREEFDAIVVRLAIDDEPMGEGG